MSGRMLAIVPAAGRGSRLGLDRPKIFAPVCAGVRIWDILYETLAGLVDHIHLVLSPAGSSFFQAELEQRHFETAVSCSIQPAPRGMGDAVFTGLTCCPDFDHVLVVWGDQVSVARETLKRTLSSQSRFPASGFSVPLVEMDRPYVQYEISPAGVLTNIRQSREGDVCDATGLSDVGVFAFTCQGLLECWKDYGQTGPVGARTREINLLPFLPYLSSRRGWPFAVVSVSDPEEARGINTREDLAHFRPRFFRDQA